MLTETLIKMLSVFGLVFQSQIESPKYTTLNKSDYISKDLPVFGFELRQYSSIITARTEMKDTHSGFKKLAHYIGVFGEADNSQNKKMPMTTPVLSNNIEDNKSHFMSFVLPSYITTTQDAPVPNDSDVSIQMLDVKLVAVRKFTWNYTPSRGLTQINTLIDQLKQDKLLSQDASIDSVKFYVAQYNSPWTIPFFKTNEIWIEIDAKSTPILLA